MNMTTFRSWLGQITTGIGALIGGPVVIALLTHQITPEQAVPGIVAAVIGLVWPENKAFTASALAVASNVEVLIPQLVTAYRSGLQHGAQATVAPAATPVVIVAAAPATPALPQAA
jgi:hypothetical protein